MGESRVDISVDAQDLVDLAFGRKKLSDVELRVEGASTLLPVESIGGLAGLCANSDKYIDNGEKCYSGKMADKSDEARSRYISRQEEWVRSTGVSVGDIVRVDRQFVSYEDGFGYNWDDAMIGFVYGDFKIDEIGNSIRLSDFDECDFAFPYFVLSVKEKSEINE